jgi:hypothetical protein
MLRAETSANRARGEGGLRYVIGGACISCLLRSRLLSDVGPSSNPGVTLLVLDAFRFTVLIAVLGWGIPRPIRRTGPETTLADSIGPALLRLC